LLQGTTDSTVTNNDVNGNNAGNASSNGANVTWAIVPVAGTNIMGGPTLGGNFWGNYPGVDSGNGLGTTPYTNNGQIAAPGDLHPIVATTVSLTTPASGASLLANSV